MNTGSSKSPYGGTTVPSVRDVKPLPFPKGRATRITKPYGEEFVPVVAFEYTGPATGIGGIEYPGYVPRKMVDLTNHAELVRGNDIVKRATDARILNTVKDRANAWEAMGAGISSSITSKVLSRFTRGTYPADKEFDLNKAIGELDRSPTAAERDFLADSVSMDDFNDRAARIKAISDAERAMDDSPVGAFVGAALGDAGGLLAPGSKVSTILNRLNMATKMQRAATIGAYSATGAAVTAAQFAPITPGEVIVNTALASLGGLLDYRPSVKGAAAPAAATAPSVKITDASANVLDEAAVVESGFALNNPTDAWVRKVQRAVHHYVPDDAGTFYKRVVDRVATPDEYVHELESFGKEIDYVLDTVLKKGSVDDETLKGLGYGASLGDVYKVLEDIGAVKRGRPVLGADGKLGAPNHELIWKVRPYKANPNKVVQEGESAASIVEYYEDATKVTSNDLAKYREWLTANPKKNVTKFQRAFPELTHKQARAIAEAVKVAGKLGPDEQRYRKVTTWVEEEERLAETAEAVQVVPVPELLKPAVVRTPSQAPEVAATVEKELTKRGFGHNIMWNMHKELSSFGKVASKVADILYSNPGDLSKHSMEAVREGYVNDLSTPLLAYGDKVRAQMALEGAGLLEQLLKPVASRHIQKRIENEVKVVLLAREQAAREKREFVLPAGTPAYVMPMVEDLEVLAKMSLKAHVQAGVKGAEEFASSVGHFSRRWDSGKMEEFMQQAEARGVNRLAAKKMLYELVEQGVIKGQPDTVLKENVLRAISKAIVERALRKGYMEDNKLNNYANPMEIEQITDIMKRAGVDDDTIEEAKAVLVEKVETEDKIGHLQQRIIVDYTASIPWADAPNGTLKLTDLISGDLMSISDQYVRATSTQAAFAHFGIHGRTGIRDLREEMLRDVPVSQRERPRQLFDETIAYYVGDPTGSRMNKAFRTYQAWSRAVALTWSGLWQVTEIANIAAKYGALSTMKYAVQELPGFKSLLTKPDLASASTLNNVLAQSSIDSLRLKPFMGRFEDGWDYDDLDGFSMSMGQVQNLIPYVNGMKYVHHWQARIVGNLIVDRMNMAVKGNAQAKQELAKYGMDAATLEKLRPSIEQHGMDVDKWTDAAWNAARPAYAQMMDTAVLKTRLGDMPSFAMFDPAGKFIFTYRSFMLTAHNKILAGGLDRDGVGATALLMLYQWPLAVLAVQAQSIVRGEGALTAEDAAIRGINQMGALGALSEISKVLSGDSREFGAPGLILADRGVAGISAIASGDAGNIANAIYGLIPLIRANPAIAAIAGQIKNQE